MPGAHIKVIPLSILESLSPLLAVVIINVSRFSPAKVQLVTFFAGTSIS
jgi:hypothetical protein